jgi:putative CocE/NonD family hydrolase
MRTIVSVLVIFSIAPAMKGQEGNVKVTQEWVEKNYTKTEVMIPMRDGIKLFTAVYEPVETVSSKGTDRQSGHPILMQRTPYAVDPYGEGYSSELSGAFREFALNRYVIVFQNVRGTLMSEGEYENIRPLSTDGSSDDATDTYDTVDWLLENTHNNGNVGIKGVSYPGFYATMAALSGHPAIKAVSPQAPVTDWFMGDDIHHNGVLFLSDTYGFGGAFFRSRPGITIHRTTALVPVTKPNYDYFLEQGSLSDILKPFGDSLVFMNDIMNHPDYDTFWKDRVPTRYFRNVRPAMLVVGGEFDAEDWYGTVETYKQLVKKSPRTETYFVEGPWFHGGWRDEGYTHLGGAYFPEGSATYFKEKVEYPFFAYYLEGKGQRPAPVTFLPSGETQKGKHLTPLWMTSQSWPPKSQMTKVFLSGDSSLSFRKPSVRHSSQTYTSDPQNPVPYFATISKGRDKAYMTGDQTFAQKRNDVLTYTGAILEDTLKVEGPIDVHLKVSTTSEDADFVVKLIDVREDGYEMLIRGDIMRGRYRKSFTHPLPLKVGKVTTVDFRMCDIAHYFLPGHRLMVQVQSSWFPLAARNPQTYVKNLYKATKSDYRKADITIYHQRSASSYITLPVVK